MMLAGVKTGVTQSVSAISQPQDSGAQMLSRSSSVCGSFPWKSWTAFLQAGDTRGGARGSSPPEMPRDGPGEGGPQGMSHPSEQQPEPSCLWLPQ